MWRMLQADEPDTFVLAANRSETVRDFLRTALKVVGIDLEFRGVAGKETVVDAVTGKTVVRTHPQCCRLAEVGLLTGSPAKAKAKLGWEPHITLEQLCQMMVAADLRRNERGVSF
jgi:GDPmannose 4,6-dehydratase